MQHVRSTGAPMLPGTGTMFIGQAYEAGSWLASWEEKPNGTSGIGTQAQIRDWVLQVRPRRVVAWDGSKNDYVDLDVRQADWPDSRRHHTSTTDNGDKPSGG